MRAARFEAFGAPSTLHVVDVAMPKATADEAVVAIRAAAINPSDVKNVAGKMSQTKLPRTPGRDFAGVVSAGPAEWMGAEVWGTGGDLGFTRDGTHAQAVLVPVGALRRKPAGLTFSQAAAVGTPFLVAQLGLKRAGVSEGHVVLVVGAAGAVGSAVVQIAAWRGARVVGVVLDEKQADVVRSFGASDVLTVHRGEDPTAAFAKQLAKGGVDIAFDTSGVSLNACVNALRHKGRVVAITAPPDGKATFDLRELYRRDGQIIGVDSLKLTSVDAASILEELGSGFEAGALRPPTVIERPLSDIVAAYETRGKVVLTP